VDLLGHVGEEGRDEAPANRSGYGQNARRHAKTLLLAGLSSSLKTRAWLPIVERHAYSRIEWRRCPTRRGDAAAWRRHPVNDHPGDPQVKTSDSVVEIRAPATKVWRALTEPDLVKQWQYGSDLQTTWAPGTPIVFRNEWNGQTFEQKGTVLEFTPGARLKYSLFFPRPDLEDIPENHFFMTYELTGRGDVTSVLFRQEDPRPSDPDESAAGSEEGPDVLAGLKELVEVKMS
jgi:uncharacterized protein YndB with AHSA1/START domain